MTGLEKIISQIKEEADASAAKLVEDAQQEAAALITESRGACEDMLREAAGKDEAQKAAYESRVKSSADQQRRTALLGAKQAIISEVIEEAYRSLKNEGTEEYFATMEKVLKAYALPEDGEIYFSAADLKRMPAGFEEKIKAAAKAKGGSLTLQKEPKEIADGFILVYGGIEENCTLKALFDEKKDVLQDQVNNILFV